MAVFPENMAKLQVNNSESNFNVIERYIRYMTERIEFSIQNVTRNVNAAGVSTVEIVQAIAELQSSVTSINSTLTNFINTTAQNFTTVNNHLSNIDSSITSINTELDDLDRRVTALEEA